MSSGLYDFIVDNRDTIINRARLRASQRMPLSWADAKLQHGIPLFLTQLADSLAMGSVTSALHLPEASDANQGISDSAALHGADMLRGGFTVAQVVHGYGDVCQIVTELATETNAPISANDFHVFNRCIDDAIAGAVTAYGQQREHDISHASSERLGVLAHELRNLLYIASLSFDVLKKGMVGPGGSTGMVLARSLSGLSLLVERSLAEVRLEAGTPQLERLSVLEFMAEIEVGSTMQADARHIDLKVAAVDRCLMIAADWHLLASALSNLLQNAFKFSRPDSIVSLSTRATLDRILIDVGDECGGLPAGRASELLAPFTQGSSDRSGLGLGLSIALNAVRANSGELSVRDIPGQGCVFTIDLPRQPDSVPATDMN